MVKSENFGIYFLIKFMYICYSSFPFIQWSRRLKLMCPIRKMMLRFFGIVWLTSHQMLYMWRLAIRQKKSSNQCVFILIIIMKEKENVHVHQILFCSYSHSVVHFLIYLFFILQLQNVFIIFMWISFWLKLPKWQNCNSETN